MARPRIFVSSTYYDLKHVRSSIELFVESLGYDPILSEKGDIAYHPDMPLDESCYREASSADIFVLIVGGRYGSAASVDGGAPSKTFFDRYDSITRKEFEAASDADIPTFILIDSGVYSEYQTYLKNKGNDSIVFAHVDSVNIFVLIDDILARPKNNPIHTFEKSSEIEIWLREQWAGLFREMLQSRSQQRQLLALTGQVGELKEVNETLKKYLEAIMKGVSKEDLSKLIEEEEKRLLEATKLDALRRNGWFQFMSRRGYSEDEFLKIMTDATDLDEFASLVAANAKSSLDGGMSFRNMLETNASAQRDFNFVRMLLDRPIISFPHPDIKPLAAAARPKTRPRLRPRPKASPPT